MPTIPQLPAASVINAGDLFVLDQQATTKNTPASLVATSVAILLNLGTAAYVNVPISPHNGGTGVADPTQHTLPVAEGSNSWNFLGPLTNGQLLIGSSNNDPVPANLIAGAFMSITNAPGSITLTGTGSATPFSWTVVTGATQTMASNNGYFSDRSSLVTLTLPATSAVGDLITVIGQDTGGWSIAQGAGQQIIIGNQSTTVGGSGSVSSTNKNDAIDLVCMIANTTWITRNGPQGNLTIV